MLCVLILYISGGIYSLNTTPNDRFFEKHFMAVFLIYSQSFCQKSAERKSPKKYFFVFCFDVWPGGGNACKQGKVSDCGQHGDHQDDPCLAVFKLTRSLFVAPPGWHSSTR